MQYPIEYEIIASYDFYYLLLQKMYIDMTLWWDVLGVNVMS